MPIWHFNEPYLLDVELERKATWQNEGRESSTVFDLPNWNIKGVAEGVTNCDILSISSGKHPRHLRDGCVENVEDELRRDADGEHEQGHRNNDEFLASQKIGKRPATLSQGTAEERLHGARKCDRRDEQTNYCNAGEPSRCRE